MEESNLRMGLNEPATSSTPPVAQSFPGLALVKRLSYGPRGTGNFLVRGDNMAVMDSLGERMRGRVKCAYLDPPYRTGERYTHYDDDAKHEDWLRALTACIRSVWALLADDGSIWISIDDREVHYLKVAADRVLGRDCFVTTIIWQQRTTRENRRVFSNNHEYLLVYAKDPRKFTKARNGLALTDDVRSRYV